jgi:hypothetical protein
MLGADMNELRERRRACSLEYFGEINESTHY